MSVLNGEVIVCGQRNGGDVQLRIYGDEYYARYETLDGYTVVYDKDQGSYCYAILAVGKFISSGVPIGKPIPTIIRKHLKEDHKVRNEKFGFSYAALRPVEMDPDTSGTRTLGPDDGLLSGRKLHHGKVKGLTIIVDFDDVTTNITKTQVDEMFNGANYRDNGNFCSVNEYFNIISSGKLDYENHVIGPIKLSKRRSHYISNLLVKEALDKAVADFNLDLSDYDSRNEGIIDAINFLYAGDSQYNGQLWPHNSVKQINYGSFRSHYYQLTGLGSHAVDLRIGTICHENGHLLCRFPDMYDYGQRDGDSEKSQGIGRYCLMGSGNHLNNRRTPAPVCAYLRELAGWVDNVVLLDSPGILTANHGSYDTAFKFKTTLPNEYFMVENRSQLGLDSHLPANGLAVYHCDTLGSNEWQDGTRNKHYQCALLQADGSLDLENNRNAGDSTDLFSQIQGVALSDTTSPSSRMWNGTDSGLKISEISNSGPSMKFTVGSPVSQPGIDIEVFPNLVIPDKSQNSKGISSSIQVNESGELIDLAINVHIIHSWISDLIVSLISPSGDIVILHNREGGNGDDILKTYNFTNKEDLKSLQGKEINGEWKLEMVDKAAQDVGRLLSWGINAKFKDQTKSVSQSSNPNKAIPDFDTDGISDLISIAKEGSLINISVDLDISHTYIGDLRIDLISPSGQSVRLHNKTGGSTDNLKKKYNRSTTPDFNDFVGGPIKGDWKLQIRDLASLDVGELVKWNITIEY